MEEKIYEGKFVMVGYIKGEEGERVYSGELERITLGEDDTYKFLFRKYYDADTNGEYKLIHYEIPVLRSITREKFIGITPESEQSLNDFYEEINEKTKQIISANNRLQKQSEKENLRNNFYSNGTKMGFLPTDSDELN